MIVSRSYDCRACNGSAGMPVEVDYILDKRRGEFSGFFRCRIYSMGKLLLAHGLFWVWVVFQVRIFHRVDVIQIPRKLAVTIHLF